MYNQPNLFVEEANQFLEQISKQILQFNSSRVGAKANDPIRQQIMGELLAKNTELKEKLLTLLDLTRAVL